MNTLRIILDLMVMFNCLISVAQTETLKTVPAKHITTIPVAENQSLSKRIINELEEKVLDHNFIVVGETHGIRESTELIKEIAQLKKFDRFITEIDSFSIGHIAEHIKSASSVLQEMPGVFAMYSYKEELELLNLLRDAGAGLNGVDQIHPVSIRLILSELAESESLSARSIERLKALIKSHSEDLSNGFLTSRTKRQTIHLLSKLLKHSPANEKSLVHHLLKSLRLGYSMKVRSQYMIEGLSRLIDSSSVMGENVLFKFGASLPHRTEHHSGQER